MTNDDANAHYTFDSGYEPGTLWNRIEAALREAGLCSQAPSPEELAPVDQFHSRGLAATQEIIASSGITRDMRVLDVGGGLGGPARLLASRIGCSVEVLDANDEFCHAGRALTGRTGLSDLVRFTHGNALDIPHPDATFDAVWTQHSTMNIPDKHRLYSETERVLKPGGLLTTHEVYAGDESPPGSFIHLPVPWASITSENCLLTQDETRRILHDLGLEELLWQDETSKTLDWFEARTAKVTAPHPSDRPPGLELVLGERFGTMLRNQVRNLSEGKIAVARGLFSKPETTRPHDGNHSR